MYVAGKNEKTVGRNTAMIKNCFNYEEFFKEVAMKSDHDEKNLSSKEMKEIERLSLLNGTNEKDAANILVSVYDSSLPKGKRVDLNALSKEFQEACNYKFISARKTGKKPNLVSGDSELASKINLMETVSPKDFLSILQNGSVPARSEVRLINDISKNFNFATFTIFIWSSNSVNYIFNTILF